MPNWNGLIITKKGRDLQAKVEAGKTALNLTKIKIGAGTVPPNKQLEDLTDLVAPKQNVGIALKEVLADGQCRISATITNNGVNQGFYVKELGVFAQDPNVGEILYAVTNDSAPDYLPAQGGATVVSQEFAIHIAIGNASNITVKIDPTSLATMGYVKSSISIHDYDPDTHTAAFKKHNDDFNAHKDFTGASTSAAGKRGMVPAPAKGKQNAVLAGNGAWLEADEIDMTPVGDVVFRPFLKKGYVKANGATVNRADYPRLVAFANANNLWTDNPTAEPWKFGRGNGSSTMVMPDYRNRVIQGGDTPRILAAGLPNIESSFSWMVFQKAGTANSMPTPWKLEDVPELQKKYPAFTEGGQGVFSGGYWIKFNANQSNKIFGSSSTVQPPAIALLPQIRF